MTQIFSMPQKEEVFKKLKKLAKTVIIGLFIYLAIGSFGLGMLAGAIGMKQIKLASMIAKAYKLWKAGSSVRAALSAATGGWTVLINLVISLGIAYVAQNNWVIAW